MFPYNSITRPRKRQLEPLSIQQQKRQNTLKTNPMPSISLQAPPNPSLAKITKIVNARLLLNHEIVSNTYLWFQNGRIIHPQDLFFSLHRDADEIIDAKGLLVVPGFVDIQINGAFGIDFTVDIEDVPSVTDEELKNKVDKVAKGLLKFGCTSFCPTVISSEQEVYHRILPSLRPRRGTATTGAHVLGAHIEGPFISEAKKGAHKQWTFSDAKNGISDLDTRYGPELAAKTAALVPEGVEERAVKIITIAPEVAGLLDVVPELVRRGITVSIGHSEAKIAEAEVAIANGVTCITHLFNAMQAFHHRDPGMVGLLGSTHLPIPPTASMHPRPSQTSPSFTQPDPRPYYGIICDGIHVHPNSVKIAYYSHPKGAILVTDAMEAMGFPAGTYSLGGRKVTVDEGLRAYLEGTTTLAGSAITMDACIRNFYAFTRCTVVEAIEAATLHPAQLMGIEHRKGTLNVGADADLVFLDDSRGLDKMRIAKVFVAGEEVNLATL